MVLLGFSNPSPFTKVTKSLSFVYIPLLKVAHQVSLPLVEVLVCPVGPSFLSLFSDHVLLSLIHFAFIALVSFAALRVSGCKQDEAHEPECSHVC